VELDVNRYYAMLYRQRGEVKLPFMQKMNHHAHAEDAGQPEQSDKYFPWPGDAFRG